MQNYDKFELGGVYILQDQYMKIIIQIIKIHDKDLGPGPWPWTEFNPNIDPDYEKINSFQIVDALILADRNSMRWVGTVFKYWKIYCKSWEKIKK